MLSGRLKTCPSRPRFLSRPTFLYQLTAHLDIVPEYSFPERSTSMAMQPIASVVLLEQSLPERFIAAVRVGVRKARLVAVLALGLALVPLPPQAAFGQINSQQ